MMKSKVVGGCLVHRERAGLSRAAVFGMQHGGLPYVLSVEVDMQTLA
jgi:hypothetical protein